MKRTVIRLMAAAATPLALLIGTGIAVLSGAPSARAATSGPCDIYAAGGTPCVAAHSTTRALYAAYTGALYQVKRSSDNATRDIGVDAGGLADAAAQDSFCGATTCLISIIYDQSGRANHLTQAPPGSWPGPAPGGYDNLADAKKAPITISGQKAYGVYIAPGTGYRNNRTSGVATGDQPEGIYAVVDGTHYAGYYGCCFDYGNAQTTNTADGPAIMETVYFGANHQWGWGDGNGPWVMADLEFGLFSGKNAGYNPNPTINHRFVTAIVKGEPNHWAIREGNAQSGSLTTVFNGQRPNGYNPMKKQGAILLGIGGDNSGAGEGTFYEGTMTTGYPSDATEAAVQANIIAAAYAPPGAGNPTPTPTSTSAPTPTPSTGSGTQIVGGQSGRCVTAPNQNAGTQTELQDCTGATNQVWTSTSSKQLQLAGNMCLDANGAGASNGTSVIVWDCNGQANQQWNVNSDGTITGVQSGLCLDANGAGTANGTKIILWSCNGQSNQQWSRPS